jgi:hypothetical protein
MEYNSKDREIAEKLGKQVELDPELILEIMSPYRISLGDVEWKPFELGKEERFTLGPNAPQAEGALLQLRPETVDDVREWVGIPRRVFEKNPELIETKTKPLSKKELYSVSPEMKFEETKDEQRTTVLSAAHNLVYGYIDVELMETPVYVVAERHVIGRILPMFFFPSIIVQSGSTLEIDPNVSNVNAFRVKIYSGGQIKTSNYSNVSMRAYSVESNL